MNDWKVRKFVNYPNQFNETIKIPNFQISFAITFILLVENYMQHSQRIFFLNWNAVKVYIWNCFSLSVYHIQKMKKVCIIEALCQPMTWTNTFGPTSKSTNAYISFGETK